MRLNLVQCSSALLTKLSLVTDAKIVCWVWHSFGSLPVGILFKSVASFWAFVFWTVFLGQGGDPRCYSRVFIIVICQNLNVDGCLAVVCEWGRGWRGSYLLGSVQVYPHVSPFVSVPIHLSLYHFALYPRLYTQKVSIIVTSDANNCILFFNTSGIHALLMPTT